MPEIPWAGLVALVIMFLIPFLPDWLFEGPRTVRHWPRRHLCGECGTLWSDGHDCEPDPRVPTSRPLRGELLRTGPGSLTIKE